MGHFCETFKIVFYHYTCCSRVWKKNSLNRKLRSLRNKFYLMLIDIAVYNVLVKKKNDADLYFGQLWEVTKDKDTKEQAFFLSWTNAIRFLVLPFATCLASVLHSIGQCVTLLSLTKTAAV